MLFIVGTPIGNLEDLSYRQARTLAETELILTEDTRTTGTLLQRIPDYFPFKISDSTKLISYYKENEFEKLPQILSMLEEDMNIVLISQAGMPLISDPGYLLVKTVIKKGLAFTVIPGPTAETTALLYSGFNPQEHMFLGFLPKKTGEIKKLLEKFVEVKKNFPDMTAIVYESPNRINETLQIIAEILPEVPLSISRELTKKFEETKRGTASQLVHEQFKGELTVVLG
jgi:16S rRNA (cytidine1402-2'-O)-methyltransferase